MLIQGGFNYYLTRFLLRPPPPPPTPPHPTTTHNSKSSLNQPKQVGSWWNFHRSFWWMLAPIWHHHQVHQECPCPPRLREKTWRTGGVLTWFLMSDLEETLTDTLDGCSLPSETIPKTSSQTISLIVVSNC